MYRKNKRSQQPLLISDIHNLPERSEKYLKDSWAECFRREVFLRIPEDRFAVLYTQEPSRPNVPVNILIGLEILKGWRGWSDEELYEHFLFDLQVRYALGCDNVAEDNFDLRTLYYLRRRMSQYALQENGENLMAVVFEQITDEQIKKLEVKTGLQRMDSTQIMSNIADLSRLELLVEVLQRLYRMLSETDQAVYAAIFQAYIKDSAGQYSYRIRGKAAVAEHIQQIGAVLSNLLSRLSDGYSQETTYQVAQRFFDENFTQEDAQVRAKTNQEITPGCLQSLDDLEATYRIKGNAAYKGYVANFTETCDPSNPVQLITCVQVDSNRTSDVQLLQEALPLLVKRTDLEKLITDGGYISPDCDDLLRQHHVEQCMTALTGTLPDHQDGKLALSDFAMALDENGNVTQATCPAAQTATIQPNPSGKSFRLHWDAAQCAACPSFQQNQCPVRCNKKGVFCLSVPKDRAISSQRRRRFEQCKAEARALRPAVEATVFQVKHPFANGKVAVRGLFRTTCVILASALATNLRRISRYENDQQHGKDTPKEGRAALSAAFRSFVVTLSAPFCRPLAHSMLFCGF
jgi:hypothetical protein